MAQSNSWSWKLTRHTRINGSSSALSSYVGINKTWKLLSWGGSFTYISFKWKEVHFLTIGYFTFWHLSHQHRESSLKVQSGGAFHSHVSGEEMDNRSCPNFRRKSAWARTRASSSMYTAGLLAVTKYCTFLRFQPRTYMSRPHTAAVDRPTPALQWT